MPTPERQEAARLFDLFQKGGAQPVDAPILLQSETLLDLYGEDLRARAYVTSDPEQGEMMMRPDFTVPVVQMHMRDGAEPARYTYQGPVFRKQEPGAHRAIEYWQVGLELFDRTAPQKAEADVFCSVRAALGDLRHEVVTGDMGILLAAVQGLETSDKRKAALARHIWRPARFQRLLDRFCGRVAPADHRAEVAALDEAALDARIAAAGGMIGLRSRGEVAARVASLRADAAQPPIPEAQAALLDALFAVAGPSGAALAQMRGFAMELPSIQPALDRLEARLEALADQGVAAESLPFEAGYGRAAMEYYDGFVFGLYAVGGRDAAPLATGGRYDALTRVLGQGREIPAVGAVIRPGQVAAMRGQAEGATC